MTRCGVATAVVAVLLATHRLWSAFNGVALVGSMAIGGLSMSARSDSRVRYIHLSITHSTIAPDQFSQPVPEGI